MKLRRVSRSLILTSLFLLVLSVTLTSTDLLKVAILPLLLLAFPNLPFKVQIVSAVLEGGERVGDELKVTINLKVTGFGVVKIMHVLPEPFDLIEGSNARGAFILGTGIIEIQYICVPMKRGSYNLGKLICEAENIFATRRVRRFLNFEKEIEVKSRVYRIRRVEMRRGIARRPIPEIDLSKTGVPSTDFREIRKYIPGDPVKFINWKVTAKLGELMVNEFEREGKKAVWIFLDANPYMLHGDVRRNCFETAIEIAASLSYFFAVRGHKVGMYVVGHGLTIYPESGRRQFSKIFSTLMRLDVSKKQENFGIALEKTKKYIEAVKPASIFITRAEYSNPVDAAIKAMGRANLPVSVVTVRMGDSTSTLASIIVHIMRENVLRKLRGIGVNVVEVEAGKMIEKVMVGLAR